MMILTNNKDGPDRCEQGWKVCGVGGKVMSGRVMEMMVCVGEGGKGGIILCW